MRRQAFKSSGVLKMVFGTPLLNDQFKSENYAKELKSFYIN